MHGIRFVEESRSSALILCKANVPMEEAHRACLLGDLKVLAQEAKRPESLAGQLTGWISGPEHPAVKDAAEKVIQRLEEDSWIDVLVDNEVGSTSTC
jgi:hypothetical protein